MVSLSNHEVPGTADSGAEMDEAVTVYILRCADGSYYTGVTRKPVDARVWEHNSKLVEGYTSTRRPVELVFAEPFASIVDTIAMERRIKGWSRAKKEALIARDFERRKLLARNRQGGGNDPRSSTSIPMRIICGSGHR